MSQLDPQMIRQVYLDALTKGWAHAQPKITPVPNMPGYDEIRYQHSHAFLVVDQWCSRKHSRVSSGTTTVFLNEEPVWCLHYGGYYEKHVLLFLKSCLTKAIAENEFYGGRGPRCMRTGELIYRNTFSDPTLSNGEGREEILDARTGLDQGYHWYRWMTF